jgi:nitroimidazol reductase NimA-like FMN-containing flavoprotein (pyridoxamine 5'-phosphate oxidase superfamily)/ribosomal protein S18 acetylase RimI-like enzyme
MTMRAPSRLKRLSRAADEDAWALFRRAPGVRVAAASADGQPVLRTLSAVVVDGALCFHGGDDGEKLGLVGRRALASCEEVVAQVSSTWIHPELACPASTYYLSAFAEGTVRRVDDLEHKARVLNALMERFQPEGGHVPIAVADRRYTRVLEQLLVAELVPERLSAKHKLGQHRSKAQIEAVLAGLWQRGASGDARAIRLVSEAHPERPTPPFLRGPAGSRLCVAPDARDAAEVAQLLRGVYWTEGLSAALMEQAHLGSSAWVVAREADDGGRVLASARAVSDGARFAWILDVIVRAELRGGGLGKAVVKLLLEHPALRSVRCVGLKTRDAQGLYERFGFATRDVQVMERLDLSHHVSQSG